MIQPLRTVHRRAFVALAVVLPAILLAGLGARRPHPQPGAHPALLPDSARLLEASDKLWRKHAIRSEFYRNSNDPRVLYVTLQPAEELDEPDLLLYWASQEPQGNSLPAQARLLGAFAAGRAFALPQDAERSGYFVLYSLAHGTVIDVAAAGKQP